MVYPVLKSGVQVQYPLRRRTRHFIVSSRTPGGCLARIRSGREPEVGWELRYEELTDAEAQSLEDLFTATKGGLESFTFVDPLANLLRWSEDPSQAVWQKDGLGVEPFTEGGQACIRLTNASAAPAALAQVVNLPGGKICMSCEARAAGTMAVELQAGAGRRVNALSGNWRKCWATGEASIAGATTCGVIVQPGGAVEIRKLQAEAQALPTEYKAGYERSGVYEQTRFDMDGLKIIADGPDRNRAVVRLRSRMESAA
jgi:hypothetical protein